MASLVYFNENDLFAVRWLQNLYPEAVVDPRTIQHVSPGYVSSYDRCHFFSGIGGWEYALQLAGWPKRREVWTGSCPCQPFSCAGSGKGEQDNRHLWPQFRRLIEKCRPATVLGEQVASKSGRLWLSRVRLDLEAMGYAVGAADLCAAGVGAPHIRQRLFWVADAQRESIRGCGRGQDNREAEGVQTEDPQRQWIRPDLGSNGGHFPAVGLANASMYSQGSGSHPSFSDGDRRVVPGRHCPWDRSRLLRCPDGKARRIPCLESGICPVADGVPGRVGQIRGYGNAIVPQLAAVFVRSFLET